MASEPISGKSPDTVSLKKIVAFDPCKISNVGEEDFEDARTRGRSAQHLGDNCRQRSRKRYHAPRRCSSTIVIDVNEDESSFGDMTLGDEAVVDGVNRAYKSSRRRREENMQRSLTPKSMLRRRPLPANLFNPEAHFAALQQAQDRIRRLDNLHGGLEKVDNDSVPDLRKTTSCGPVPTSSGDQSHVSGGCTVVSSVSAD